MQPESVLTGPEFIPQTVSASRLARWALAAFLATFMLVRVLVLLIMTRRLPDLYLYVGGTHVHHLNHGIFLLAITGAVSLFTNPAGSRRIALSAFYGIGLGLTFDEFGMWLHLGGPYWQRASFDAVVVVAGSLGLVAVRPAWGRFRGGDWATTVGLILVTLEFGTLLIDSLRFAETRILGRMEVIEADAPR